MGIVEKLESYGVFVGDVGLASLLCADNPKQIKKAWDTGVKFIVLKTMMNSEDRPGETAIKGVQITDDNMTFYHTGTTSKEQLNFKDDSEGIVSLLNGLYNDNIVAIPSIGTKGTTTEPWEMMKKTLDGTEARVLELNLRYLYRSLYCKHMGNDRCNEYIIDSHADGEAVNEALYKSNRDFNNILMCIREIFPPNEYYLIGKMWSYSQMKLHIMYVCQNGFDALTLVNSKKSSPPEPFEKLPEGKLPQMSGLGLRPYREYASQLVSGMGYNIPVFDSGGIGMEAIRKIDTRGATEISGYREMMLQRNLQDAIKDIKHCFETGASYVQLGSVGYFNGPLGSVYDTLSMIMQELNGPPNAKTPARRIVS